MLYFPAAGKVPEIIRLRLARLFTILMETSLQNASPVAVATASPRSSGYVLWLLVSALALFPIVRLVSLLFPGGSPDAANGGYADLRRALQEPAFLHWLEYSALLAAVLTLITTTLAGFGSYAISRASMRRGHHPSDNATLSPLLGGALLLLPFYVGVLALGKLNPHIGFLLVYGLLALPFCTWRLQIAADAVPPVMLEAARIDGCSRFECFRLILLPLLRPALILSAIVSFMTAWNFRALTALQSQPSTAIATLLLSIPLLIIFLVLSRPSSVG